MFKISFNLGCYMFVQMLWATPSNLVLWSPTKVSDTRTLYEMSLGGNPAASISAKRSWSRHRGRARETRRRCSADSQPAPGAAAPLAPVHRAQVGKNDQKDETFIEIDEIDKNHKSIKNQSTYCKHVFGNCKIMVKG